MQAGHFYPTTYSFLRYDEINVNGECEKCNCHDPKHLEGYQIGLMGKYGWEELARMNTDRHKKKKLMAYEYKELIEIYTNKLKQPQ